MPAASVDGKRQVGTTASPKGLGDPADTALLGLACACGSIDADGGMS